MTPDAIITLSIQIIGTVIAALTVYLVAQKRALKKLDERLEVRDRVIRLETRLDSVESRVIENNSVVKTELEKIGRGIDQLRDLIIDHIKEG